ncbi:MAG: AsmA family protein [Flavobacteriales bacterium]|nr:AsmA family protein [Flavobacteriales bacterium]
MNKALNIVKKAPVKILKWAGIAILLSVLAIFITLYFFKNDVKDMVIDEVNNSLNAELSLGDFDLTFFSTFPNLTLELGEVKLQGVEEFEGVTLADIKLLQAHVGFWGLVSGGEIKIDEIHINEPKFDVRVLQNGKANFDIAKSEEEKLANNEPIEESNFKLSLDEYSISNGQVTYQDEPGNMHAKIVNLNHNGSGDMTADIIDFKTKTSMDELSYDMGGVSYFNKVKTDMLINLLMEFKENDSKFTLKENEINLNAVKLSFNGFYQMLEDHDEIDFKLDAQKTSFKDLLSLIPTFYKSGYEKMISNGSLSISAMTKGRIDETNLPAWDANLKVANASINYPDLPGKITNVQLIAGSKFPGGSNLDLMTLNIPKFHANLSENTIDVKLAMRQIMSDPLIDSKIIANLNLATLKDYIPMAEGESYSGLLDADVIIKGKMSDLDKNDFEKFTAEGELALSDMIYESTDVPAPVNIEKIKFTFSPSNLQMNEMKATMGKSDFAMNGKIDNYLGYMLRDEVLKGDFDFSSNTLDLDELMPASEVSSEPTAETTVTETTGESEPVLIPKNIDFRLTSSINDVKYDGLSIKNVKGIVVMKDEVATLENITMNTMGGEVGIKGNYNTQNHSQPKMNFGYTLKDVDIHELSTNFITVEKMAPITKYARGRITSDFEMATDLTAGFEPILTSLSSIGNVNSNSLSLEGVKILDKLGSVTKLKSLSAQTIKNFKTAFKIEDGKLHTSPFDLKLGKIDTEMSGFTSLDQKMDYDMKMNVPKEEIPAAMIKEVEKAMSKLNSLVPNLNVASLPDFIPVKVKMIGDIKSPKITTDFKEALLKATGSIKDNLIESVTETVKDSVTSIINNQVEDGKEELEKQRQKLLEDAQKEADKIIAEGKKAADLVRAEGDKQAAELIKQAGSNPIKKRLAQESAKQIKKSAENNAVKLEKEAQKKADLVMEKARNTNIN